MGVFQGPLTLILLQMSRGASGSRIVMQTRGVYTTFSQKEGILLQKYRHRNVRCIAILFKSIGVRGRFDSPPSLTAVPWALPPALPRRSPEQFWEFDFGGSCSWPAGSQSNTALRQWYLQIAVTVGSLRVCSLTPLSVKPPLVSVCNTGIKKSKACSCCPSPMVTRRTDG